MTKEDKEIKCQTKSYTEIKILLMPSMILTQHTLTKIHGLMTGK